MIRNLLAWGILALLLAVLALGLVRLFDLRQAGGDLHPPYSSLRADPLGTKALYLALEDLGLDLRRNYRPWRWLKPEPQGTWFLIGVNRLDFQENWPPHRLTIESLVKHGGRLIIAFEAELKPSPPPLGRLWRRVAQPPLESSKPHPPLEELWQFEFAHHPLPPSDTADYQPALAHRVHAPENWPAILAWRSSLSFTNLGQPWQVLYAVAGQPVIIERHLGAGSLVLLSDSFYLSNEALRFHRLSPLLAWLVGQPPSVIFDETHLGVKEEPGMGSLLRQYRLHGLAAVALLLALLYLWQNTFPLAPLPPETSDKGEPGHVVGRDATLGLINLLRRGLPPRRLLRVCLEHWKDTAGRKAATHITTAMETRLAEYEQTPARLANPVQVYQDLARLAETKPRPHTPYHHP